LLNFSVIFPVGTISGPIRLHLPGTYLNSTQVPSASSQRIGNGVDVLVAVTVGGTGVSVIVGGINVAVGGSGVLVGWVALHATRARRINDNTIICENIRLFFISLSLC
jgi:hypothetical protein